MIGKCSTHLYTSSMSPTHMEIGLSGSLSFILYILAIALSLDLRQASDAIYSVSVGTAIIFKHLIGNTTF